MVGLVLACLARINVRTTSQCSTNQHYNFVYRIFLHAVVRRSSIIHLNSQALLDRRPSCIPKNPALSVIPNGIDFLTSDFDQKNHNLRAGLGVDHNIILLGNVGRILGRYSPP